MEDKNIIELFQSRSEEALFACENKFGAYCRTVAGNILRDAEDAKECVNDAFLAVWNLIPPNSPENLKAFAGRITRNIAMSRLRKKLAQKRGCGEAEIALSEFDECIPEKGSVEKEIESREITAAIEKFLYSNPEEKRNIFIRRYWYMFSVSEIAESYGMTEAKVKSILFRMRKELKNKLEKEGFF